MQMKMRFFKRSRFSENVSVYGCSVLVVISCALQFIAAANLMANDSSSSTLNESVASMAAAAAAATASAATQPSTNQIIQKFAISDLTRDLSLQLKSIQDHELLIPTIQSALDSIERVPSTSEHNATKILNSIASKIDLKLAAALRILNETNQKICNIFTSENIEASRKLVLDAIVLPCSSSNKHSERSAHDSSETVPNENDKFGGFNKKKAIEVLNFLKNAGHLHEHGDKNYTINKRLMETLKTIDLTTTHVPNFRDAFFLPRDSQITNTNCRMNNLPNEYHRYRISHIFCCN